MKRVFLVNFLFFCDIRSSVEDVGHFLWDTTVFKADTEYLKELIQTWWIEWSDFFCVGFVVSADKKKGGRNKKQTKQSRSPMTNGRTTRQHRKYEINNLQTVLRMNQPCIIITQYKKGKKNRLWEISYARGRSFFHRIFYLSILRDIVWSIQTRRFF